MPLKRLYTIERASTPLAPRRYLGERGDELVWASPERPILTWKTGAAALWFAAYRMGLARNDAVIVEHVVH